MLGKEDNWSFLWFTVFPFLSLHRYHICLLEMSLYKLQLAVKVSHIFLILDDLDGFEEYWSSLLQDIPLQEIMSQVEGGVFARKITEVKYHFYHTAA